MKLTDERWALWGFPVHIHGYGGAERIRLNLQEARALTRALRIIRQLRQMRHEQYLARGHGSCLATAGDFADDDDDLLFAGAEAALAELIEEGRKRGERFAYDLPPPKAGPDAP